MNTMTNEKAHEIAATMIEQYLTADYGQWLTVSDDGTAVIMDGSSYPPAGTIAQVKCPGMGNLDSTRYTEGASDPTDLLASIRECCEVGDMTDDIDGLADAIIRDAELD
jgi:hypothetical protein